MRNLIRQIIGNYKSIKLEGQDEGYVVFSGEEPDTKQNVSIKILPRLLGNDPQITRRFQGLAQTIRQLNHPNIATVRQVGDEAGLPYLITRVIEKGHPLATKLDQPWAVDTVADVVMQVGQALEHAYNKGIVHGGLTPDNIVVQDDGRILVGDFGLSELMDMVGAKAAQGASPYLAPERQAGGSVSAAADVYSLAAIQYSLLTKRQPQVVKGEVLPPSRFNPEVPLAMDQVLVKALAPDPANRYPNAKTFLAALGAVTLVPTAEKAAPASSVWRCPMCGARDQDGRFCRKCGTKMPQQKSQAQPRPQAQPKSRAQPRPQPEVPASKLDEPIQITRIEVGRVEIGQGVEVRQTVIARPMPVASGELLDMFPEPLEMPRLDATDVWAAAGGPAAIAMPEPPPMPVIDWAEIAPPMPEVPDIQDIPMYRDDA